VARPNIEANDYRLIAVVQYENGVMMIRFFGSHEEYDQVAALRTNAPGCTS
jgi:mRNA interferase HigB